MTRPPIGYLVPQFPGQTHIFFWREIAALEAMGQPVKLLSTTLPARGLMSHGWTDEAVARTSYLGKARPLAMAGTLAATRPLWWADMRREGRALGKDIAVAATSATALRRVCKADGISHVHVHSCGRAALIAMLAEAQGGASYSLTLHGPMSDYGPGQRLKWRHARFGTIITRKLLAEAREALGEDMPAAMAVRGMGVDVEAFARPAPYAPPAPGETVKVFACGRLNVVKGHQDLMAAVRMLLERGVRVALEVAGEDDDGGGGFHLELERVLSELGLEGQVRLLGAISAEAVRERLWDAHIFCLASWHEPLGVAYMEAMAAGVPVIGTAAGGVPELLSDGVDGLMVPPKTPEALAAAIERLAGDAALAARIAQAGRQRVVDGFRAELGAETLVELLDRTA